MKLLRTSSLSIRVRPSFFILSFVFSLFAGATIGETFLIMSILFAVFFFHEIGHMAVAYLLSRPCETVIGAAGGKTEVFGPNLKLWQRALVLAGGIAATYFVFAGTRVYLIDAEGLSDTSTKALLLLCTLSVYWFWFNVIPLYPLDAGEFLVDIGRSLFGRFGERSAAILNMLLAGVIAVFLLLKGFLVGAILCFYSLTQSFILFKHPAHRADDLSEDSLHLHELRQKWLMGDQDDVITAMEKLAEGSEEKEVRQEAVECCSGYLLATEHPREAYEFLKGAKDDLTQSALEHLQLAAYRTSHWSEGLEAGKDAYREYHTLPVATLCAMLAGRMGMAEEAVAWLRTARELGLSSLAAIVESTDFDPIRTSHEFQAEVEKRTK